MNNPDTEIELDDEDPFYPNIRVRLNARDLNKNAYLSSIYEIRRALRNNCVPENEIRYFNEGFWSIREEPFRPHLLHWVRRWVVIDNEHEINP
jgi:hypothetical protein